MSKTQEFGNKAGNKRADTNRVFSDELKKSLIKSLSFFGISRETIQNSIVESDMVEMGMIARSEIVKDFVKRVDAIDVSNRLKRYNSDLDTISSHLKDVAKTPVHVFLDVSLKDFFAMSKAVRQTAVKKISKNTVEWKSEYLKDREKEIALKVKNCEVLQGIEGEVILQGLAG